ncbi:MAG: SOS response-associated peptidase [Chloroflexota bacterium]|nr:SOS response-associated peptidase [Chloroflexota bacterium]MBI5704106.1 SOS response-associated peptidase [Chloroflexota bacterium]
MCGRFTLTVDPAQFQDAFPGFLFPAQFAPRYNIAPSQPVLAIPNDERSAADFFIWGLIPMWAKDPSIGARLINARSETLAEKPSFRGSFKYKRCLILADGFYEWKTVAGKKTKIPYYIHMNDRRPFAFAGLWDSWESPDGSNLKTCTIITTEPNELMATLHNRMPAILHPRDYAKWLDPSPQTPESLLPLLKPYPADAMTAYPVSTLVNKPENDSPELIVPA